MHGKGKTRFLELKIRQSEGYTWAVDGDSKLMNIKPAPLTRLWRKDVIAELKDLKKSVFFSLNSLLGWLGTTVFPHCFAVASRLQQHPSSVHILGLIKQNAVLEILERLGSEICFSRSTKNLEHSISGRVFFDARRPSDIAKFSEICDLLIGRLD